MAPLTLFQYDPRPSFLSALDPRLKLGLLAAAGVCSAFLGPAGLASLGAAVVLLFPLGKASLGKALRGGAVLWFILTLLFLSRLFGLPGRMIFSLPGTNVTATAEGLSAGLFEAGRILILVLLGHLFLACTTIAEIRRALASLLSFLPGTAGPETAFLLGLAASMVSRLLFSAGEIKEALALRGFRFTSSPLKGTLLFGRAFVKKALHESGAAAEALEARHVHFRKSEKPLRPGGRDAAAFIAAAAALTASLML